MKGYLFKNYVSQTRKPEGFLGRMMLGGMNAGHAKLADWGFTHLPAIHPDSAVDLGCGGGWNASDGTDPTSLKFEKIIDGMKNYTAEEIGAALKAAGFSEVTSDHHPSKPWITVLARRGVR